MRDSDRDPGYVSGRFLADFLGSVERRGVDLGELLAGLDVPPESSPPEGHPLVAWDDFVEILERLEDRLGGPEGLRELGSGVKESYPAAILRRVAGLWATPLTLYRVAERWALRRAIPLLENEIEPLGDGRVRVATRIPERYRACPAYFHLAQGIVESAPGILGLPDAIVHATVGPRDAEFLVALPPSGTVAARLGRAVRSLFSARAAFDQLEKQQRELHDHFAELRRAYAVLETSELRHRAMAETAADVVVEIGPDDTVQYMSPSGEALTGLSGEEVVGRPFFEFLHPDDLICTKGLSRTENRERELAVLRVLHRDGTFSHVEVSARPYSTSGGRHHVAILRDVSERVRLEEDRRRYGERLEGEVARRTEQLERRNLEMRELQSLLIDAERMGARHDLAGRIAHSINNPLGSLIGQLQLALHDTDEAHRPPLEKAHEQAQRAAQVVSRTLELYRRGKLDRSLRSPAVLLREIADEIEAKALLVDARLCIEIDDEIAPLPMDASLLGGALTRLAENALESLEGGGRLTLGCRDDAAGAGVAFDVVDDGPGIAPELRDRIFDPFFTTKRTGSGLGLSIAERVVTAHGGRIEIESRPEREGTRVRVWLPRSAGTEAPPA